MRQWASPTLIHIIVQRQAITWTYVDLLFLELIGKTFSVIWIKWDNIYSHEIHLEIWSVEYMQCVLGFYEINIPRWKTGKPALRGICQFTYFAYLPMTNSIRFEPQEVVTANWQKPAKPKSMKRICNVVFKTFEDVSEYIIFFFSTISGSYQIPPPPPPPPPPPKEFTKYKICLQI